MERGKSSPGKGQKKGHDQTASRPVFRNGECSYRACCKLKLEKKKCKGKICRNL